MDHLVQIILLSGVTCGVMVAFQRLHIPSSLGYLLVGLILGPHTVGPTVHVPEFKVLAEFGVVFLLFSIGLNYSLPQLHAMRHQILGLGTAQVALTTAAVATSLWLAGLSPAVAFRHRRRLRAVLLHHHRPATGRTGRGRLPRTAGSAWPFRCSRMSPPCRS
jgi:CPA2 family monovalent cation:H+ antiporter-2